MPSLREAAQQALEALETTIVAFGPGLTLQQQAINALRAALKQPEQEPIASLMTNIQSGDQEVVWNDDGFDRALWHETPLYTVPPQRKPLTEEEIYAAIKGIDSLKAVEVARAIEKAHGIGDSK